MLEKFASLAFEVNDIFPLEEIMKSMGVWI